MKLFFEWLNMFTLQSACMGKVVHTTSNEFSWYMRVLKLMESEYMFFNHCMYLTCMVDIYQNAIIMLEFLLDNLFF